MSNRAASGTVRVVTFPIFADGTNRMGRVRVPDAFAKVAFGSFGAALWVMPNKQAAIDREQTPMTQEEQAKMLNEIFTRLREDERKTSEVCVKLDMVVEQIKTSTAVTDKFLEALDKRRITDEAREAKFWKALYIIGGALIALALGKEPVAKWAAHVWPDNPVAANIQAVIPWHDERNGFRS